MKVTESLDKIITLMPQIKRIVIDKDTWHQFAFELSQIQRVGVNGFLDMKNYVRGPIYFRNVEIWHDKHEIAPDD